MTITIHECPWCKNWEDEIKGYISHLLECKQFHERFKEYTKDKNDFVKKKHRIPLLYRE